MPDDWCLGMGRLDPAAQCDRPHSDRGGNPGRGSDGHSLGLGERVRDPEADHNNHLDGIDNHDADHHHDIDDGAVVDQFHDHVNDDHIDVNDDHNDVNDDHIDVNDDHNDCAVDVTLSLRGSRAAVRA